MDAPGVTPTRTGWRPRLSNDTEIPLRAACTASEPAARTAHSKAGDRGRGGRSRRRGIEQHEQLLARVILDLADGEAAAPRGRAPVHAPQRLPDLVIAHARELVARARAERVARTVPERERTRALSAELHEPRLDA